MIRHSFIDFFRFCRTNILFFVLSFLCLVCAFGSFLFILGKASYMYEVNSEMNQETRVLYFACNDKNTILKVYEKLESESELPKMAAVTVSDDIYTGLYWDGKSNEEFLHTPYGRLFSAQEMDSGATAALLGVCFFEGLSMTEIEDTWITGIDINGIQFNAIGNYFFDSSFVGMSDFERVPTAITIPLKTYFDIGLVPLRFRCEFSDPLTSIQVKHLNDMLKPFSNIRSLSMPKSSNDRAVNNYLETITVYIAILLVSLISIVSVILYWLREEFARYRIYLICGAKGRQIAYFISMNVVLIVSITYFCAYLAVSGIMKITPPGFVSPSPWQLYIVIYISVMIFMLLAVIMRSVPIVFRENMLNN